MRCKHYSGLSDSWSFIVNLSFSTLSIASKDFSYRNRSHEDKYGRFVEAIALHVSIPELYIPKDSPFSLHRHPSYLSGRRDDLQPSGDCSTMPCHGEGNGDADS